MAVPRQFPWESASEEILKMICIHRNYDQNHVYSFSEHSVQWKCHAYLYV